MTPESTSPLEITDAQPTSKTGSSDGPSSGPVVKCLLVDDREENLLALRALLRDEGVELLSARSAAEALELLLVHEVALALLDVQMPETDGFELAELMRGMARTQHIPIVFVTAGPRETRRQFRGYDAGAVDFLFKPIEPHILQSKARVFFELHRQKLLLRENVKELSEALRLNEMFTAVMGHDLRSPLNAIALSAKMLQMAPGDPTAVAKIGHRLESSARRMSGMIEDVLDFSRVRVGGGFLVQCGPADFDEIVRKVVLEHEASSPGAKLGVQAMGDLRGEWDSDRLGQVAANLIGNAIRHGQAGPIEIRLDGRQDAVVFSVRNAGSIPEEAIATLFDPFQRGRGTARRGEGLGLGLFIVQQIVLAHQGRVDVRTNQVDGTEFIVELPRRPRAAP